jgi:hypothetical protein
MVIGWQIVVGYNAVFFLLRVETRLSFCCSVIGAMKIASVYKRGLNEIDYPNCAHIKPMQKILTSVQEIQ